MVRIAPTDASSLTIFLEFNLKGFLVTSTNSFLYNLKHLEASLNLLDSYYHFLNNLKILHSRLKFQLHYWQFNYSTCELIRTKNCPGVILLNLSLDVHMFAYSYLCRNHIGCIQNQFKRLMILIFQKIKNLIYCNIANLEEA